MVIYTYRTDFMNNFLSAEVPMMKASYNSEALHAIPSTPTCRPGSASDPAGTSAPGPQQSRRDTCLNRPAETGRRPYNDPEPSPQDLICTQCRAVESDLHSQVQLQGTSESNRPGVRMTPEEPTYTEVIAETSGAYNSGTPSRPNRNQASSAFHWRTPVQALPTANQVYFLLLPLSWHRLSEIKIPWMIAALEYRKLPSQNDRL
ncbi:hypothetical protein K456DRAFT_32722 [Colletotrichum gloeosporioides 23]|nr:hypothetical protein K456DRAFT_32722 [Colletotrichum gloeosporioides 23]